MIAIVAGALLAVGCAGTENDSGPTCDNFVPPAAEQGATCTPSSRRCDGWNSDGRVCWFDCGGAPAPASGCEPSGWCVGGDGAAYPCAYCIPGENGVDQCTFTCPLCSSEA
jgi:hypothetical protein